MDLLERIARIHRIHELIRREATGVPKEFAEKLHLTERQVYNILADLKNCGADIRFSKLKCSYYYANDFEIQRIISKKFYSG